MLQGAMGAKTSAEMKEAVRLALDGIAISEAAKIAKVHRVSLHRVLRRTKNGKRKLLTRRSK